MEEIYLSPKECRRIAKEKIMPSDAEMRFIEYEYGVTIEVPCLPLKFATIRDQQYAWKALNYMAHTKKFLETGSGTHLNMVHYKETWYLVNT